MNKLSLKSGDRFERWLVLEEAGKDKHGNILWKCKCDCGTIRNVTASALSKGASKSCGCLQKETASILFREHGFSRSKFSATYSNMIQRCFNPNHPKYNTYGLRGITVCKEWREHPVSFYNWASSSNYEEGLSLDRIDNDGNYEPSNCHWVTIKAQQNNMRSNHYITYKGETKSISQWAVTLGLHPTTLTHRLKNGWTEEETVSIPKGKQRIKNK